MLGKLHEAGYAPAQGVAKALLTLLALPSSPRQSLSLKTTLVLLVYGVVREPHSLQELDQVLDQQARMRLQEAHVQELSKSGTWEEVWAVPCLALITQPSATGSWPESLTQPSTWGSILGLAPSQIRACDLHASQTKMVPCNTWLLLRQVITVQVELLRGTVLMTTAQQLLTGDDIASLDEYKVLASQLTGRCSRYLPASHFFQVLGALYLVSNLAQHITTFAMAGVIPDEKDGIDRAFYSCLAGPPQGSHSPRALGRWQTAMQRLEPGRLMQQQEQQPFCLIPPSAINSLMRLGLRALGSEHGGNSSGAGAVRAAGAAGTLEGGAVGQGQESFVAMLFNGGPHVVRRYDSLWRASLLYAVAKRHPEAEAALVQQALDRLLASYNATSINTMLMPLEALLVVLEPHLCPASPSASQAPLPEELPIQQWLANANWSDFMRPSLSVLFVRDDGGLSSTWQTWGPRQWTLLFSLWINCPPFKTLFLNRLAEEQLTLLPATQSAVSSSLFNALGTGLSDPSKAASPGLPAIALRSPHPSTPSSSGSASGWPTGPQASGGQAQPAQESSTRRRPEAPNPSSVNATDLREAELALALLRMGLPGNMFERGAALQSDLQQRLVQWGRWEWYTYILRTVRLGRSLDSFTVLLLSVQFAVEREEACLEALHLVGCPYDLHTHLCLPNTWPASNDNTWAAGQLKFWAAPVLGTSAGQLRQLLTGTVGALMQLTDSAVLGPHIMAAMAGVVTHQQKLIEMYAAPCSLSSGGSSSDLGPPGANDPSPKSPTAFKRDVSLTLGADYLLQHALNNRDNARLTTDVAHQVTSEFLPNIGKHTRQGEGGAGGGKKKRARRKG